MIELSIGIADALLALWFVLRALRRRRVDDRDWLPAELRAARLIYAERLFRSSGPVRVSAKVDRAYRDRAGVVVLVELKTRRADKVHLSDVIELSAQRHALMAHTGEIVAMHGYVLDQLVGQRRRKIHRVALFDDEQVAALVARREAVLTGEAEPSSASSPRLCRKCAFVDSCRHRKAHRSEQADPHMSHASERASPPAQPLDERPPRVLRATPRSSVEFKRR